MVVRRAGPEALGAPTAEPGTDVSGGVVGLSNVWLQTAADGLVRADQVTGIEAHQTPALTGKPSRWLLDVVLPVGIGSGTREGWGVSVLHRTLIQTADDPGPAATALARLLAQLDLVSATGVITTSRADTRATAARRRATGRGVRADPVPLHPLPQPRPRPPHRRRIPPTTSEYL